MPLIAFPDVPAFPGVPQLARLLGVVPFLGPALLSADDPAVAGLVSPPQWGIFDQDGNEVAVSDAVVEVEFMKEYRVSDYPQEPNSFASYNKVEMPYDATVALARSGSDEDRTAFLTAIDDACASLDLYVVAMPELTYINANLVGYRFQRRSYQGVTLVVAEIRLRQIRISGAADFSNTASPSGAAPVNGGTVLPQTPTAIESQVAGQGAN